MIVILVYQVCYIKAVEIISLCLSHSVQKKSLKSLTAPSKVSSLFYYLNVGRVKSGFINMK